MHYHDRMLTQHCVTDGDGPSEDGRGRASLEVNLFFETSCVRRLVVHDAIPVADSLGKHLVDSLEQ